MVSHRGFTLIEVMLSVLIVTLAIVLVSHALIQSLFLYRDSVRRFQRQNRYHNLKHYLESLTWDSPELSEGHHHQTDGPWESRWIVTDQTPLLKKVEISVKGYGRVKRGHFHLSYLMKRRL